jgi:UTP--glucose-1-phosphate uridylyltransferase
VVGDEPFAVVLPDDLIHHPAQGCVGQLVEQFAATGASLVAVEDVPADATDKYGIVSVDDATQRLSRMHGIVEKPAPAEAPSTLGVVGRYLLTPAIFEHLVHTPRGAGGEIQLTDAIAEEIRHGRRVSGFRFHGERFDCGSKSGFLQATVAFGLAREELRDEFEVYLRNSIAIRKAAE